MTETSRSTFLQRLNTKTTFIRTLALVAAIAVGAFLFATSPETASAQAGRTIRAVPTIGCAGFVSTVSIELDSLGNEVAASFTVNFDPTRLTNPAVALGTGAPAGTTLTINSNNVAAGQLGILVDSANAFVASPPPRQVITIQFQVIGGTPAGVIPITFSGSPTPLSTSDALANLLPTAYQAGQITVGGTPCTTAAGVSISGRVLTPTGSGIRGASVIVTNSQGERFTTSTSSLGFYQMDNVAAGQSYVVTVLSKRYRFASRIVQVNDNITDLDFVGLE